MIYLKVILAISIFTCFFAFFYYLRKSGLVKKALKNAYSTLDDMSTARAKDERHAWEYGDEIEKSFFEKLVEAPNRRFVYSGLGRIFKGLTIELWIIFYVFSVAAVYFLVLIISKDGFRSLLAAGGYAIILKGAEMFLAYRNYKTVDNNLVQFLNQLGNFSIIHGEVTGTLYKVSQYMPYPLSDVLAEGYIEAQTSGDVSEAMYSMISKIEHPKFKEIITNLEVCTSYTANSEVVVDALKQNIVNEKRASMERKSTADAAIVSTFIVSVLIIVTFFITDNLISQDFWEILFHSIPGKVALVVFAISYIIFGVNVATAER